MLSRSTLSRMARSTSSRSSGETLTAKQRVGVFRVMLVLKNTVLTDTRPNISTSCLTPAGIQTARCGGTTQVPWAVPTVMTPLEAYASWCQSIYLGAMLRLGRWVMA